MNGPAEDTKDVQVALKLLEEKYPGTSQAMRWTWLMAARQPFLRSNTDPTYTYLAEELIAGHITLESTEDVMLRGAHPDILRRNAIKELLYMHFGFAAFDDISVLYQFEVFMEALKIMTERNQVYHDVWRDGGWRITLIDMKKKVDRLWRQLRGEAIPRDEHPILNDALDNINYTAFFVRAWREKNEWGKW